MSQIAVNRTFVWHDLDLGTGINCLLYALPWQELALEFT